MSTLAIKKIVNMIVGALLLTLLLSWVIGIIGDALVDMGKHEAPAVVAVGEKAPAPKAKAPKAKAKQPAKAAGLASIAPLLAKASAADGKKIARKCVTCHTMNQGGKKRVGPNLWNVVNAAKAGTGGFRFSAALKGKGGKWTYEDLNAFLASPKSFAKGTKMAFAGIKKAGDRAALIKYLRSLSTSPAPLP